MSRNEILKQMFDEAQAELPPEDRAYKEDQRPCLAEQEGFHCTKPKGHPDGHIAHGTMGEVILRWSEA